MKNTIRTITVTTHRAKNYGAVLQAYALQQALIRAGFENELLDSANETKSIFTKISFSSFRSFLITAYTNLKRLFHYREVKKQLRGFEQFVNNHLFLTKHYSSIEELDSNPPLADIYITGSDQVFAIDCKIDQLLLKERFLDFGPTKVKRVSYAAGVGNLDLKEEQIKQLEKYLSRFDCISLREQSSCEYYSKHFSFSFRNDLDPTFLLTKEEWTKVMSCRLISEPYILCYALLGNKNLQRTVDYVKEKTGLKVVCIESDPLKRIKADKYVFNASPEDFLSLIYYSNFVVTTSFHGTAFSIIFEKQFLTLVKDYKSERMTDILKLVCLEKNIINEKLELLSFDFTDYVKPKELLQKARIGSLEYLNSLKEIVTNE